MEAALETLVDDMDAYGYSAAEQGAELARADPHGLDADECGALTLYTMQSELCAPHATLHTATCDAARC